MSITEKTMGFNSWSRRVKPPFPNSMNKPSIQEKEETQWIIMDNTKSEIRLRTLFFRFFLILLISPVLFLMIHELSHIITGLFFGINIDSFNFETRSGILMFIIYFEETGSKILDLILFASGSLGVILFGICFLIHGIIKKKVYFYVFGCGAISQDIFYMGISCILNVGDWASVFTILGFNSNIYAIFGIFFFIFYIIMFIIGIFGVEWIVKKKI